MGHVLGTIFTVDSGLKCNCQKKHLSKASTLNSERGSSI